MSEQMKPCPFCGEAPHDIPMDSQSCSFYVHCPHCGMCGPELLTPAGARSAWNTRVRSSQSPPWSFLTDEDRDRAFQTLPDMLDGFLKKWGWLHFAKAVEDICREKNAIAIATQPQAPQGAVTPGFRLLPIEPTMEMYEAAGEELYGYSREKAVEWAKEDKFESYAQTGMEAWRAMVKAAPKTPEGAKP